MPKILSKLGFFITENAPEILIGLGIGGAAVSTVMACESTLKAQSIMERYDSDMDTIAQAQEVASEDEYTDEDVCKDKAQVYARTAKDLVLTYAPSVTLFVVSIVCILGGYHILKYRYAAMAAAYKTLEHSYLAYRRRVRKEVGVDKERDLMLGKETREDKITTTDAKGKTKTQVVKETIIDPNTISPYSKFFDELCEGKWTNSPDANYLFLKAQEQNFDQKLKNERYLFLDEVYKALGIPVTLASRRAGWFIDEDQTKQDGDDFVSFGIYNMPRFVNGYENKILLDFNVEGNIEEKVFAKYGYLPKV